MPRKWILFAAGMALFALLTVWIARENTALTVSEIVVSSGRIPEAFSGYRIVQVSDLHNAEFGDNNEELLQMLAQTEADLIVLTGDLVDSRRMDIHIAVSFAAQAAEIAPVYYVTGNHEKRLEEEYPLLESRLRESGVTVLRGEAVLLEKDGQQLQLIGLDDFSFYPRNGEEQILADINALKTNERYTILLSHRPELFDIYVEADVDLIFSGHAHGGQFRLPFIGGIIAPGQGFFPRYDAGLYINGATNMVVSRGLGNSLFPFRVNNRPEIVVVELQKGSR